MVDISQKDKKGKMVFPVLPSIPERIGLRKYSPSGKCPSGAIPKILIGGIPTGILMVILGVPLGIILFVLLLLLGGIPLYILNYPIWTNCLFLLLRIIVLLFLGLLVLGYSLLYPTLVGAGVGGLVWIFAKRYKCRSSAIVSKISAICALLGYLSMQLVSLLWLHVPHSLSSSPEKLAGVIEKYNLRPNAFDIDILFTTLMEKGFYIGGTIPWWFYLNITFEIILCCIGAYIASKGFLEEAPFCEKCQNWYSKKGFGLLSMEGMGNLLLGLETEEEQTIIEMEGWVVQPIKNQKLIRNRSLISYSLPRLFPVLKVLLIACPVCNQSDWMLKVYLVAKDVNEKNPIYQIKERLWFTTMTSLQIGEILFRYFPFPTIVNRVL